MRAPAHDCLHTSLIYFAIRLIGHKGLSIRKQQFQIRDLYLALSGPLFWSFVVLL